MKNWNYWQKNYDEVAFVVWKVMQQHSIQYTKERWYGDNKALTLFNTITKISYKWPREYRTKIFNFIHKSAIKQEIEIIKILHL